MEHKKRELSIERLLEINEAVNMALAIEDFPDAIVTMEMGDLSNEVSSHLVGYIKATESERKRIVREQAKLDSKHPQWQVLHQNLNNDFSDSIEKLKAEFNKKKKGVMVKCPVFKRENFIAKEETVRFVPISQGQNKEVPVKKGQALCPPLFFKLMGDLIEA